jgi:subtilisin family serine protease
MKGIQKALASLLLAAFIAPITAVAEEVPLSDPLTETIEQASVVIEPDTGEILATSTEAIEEEVLPVFEEGTYVPGEVIVQYEGEDAPVIMTTDDTVAETVAALSEDPDVAFVEPNYVRSLDVLSSTTDTYAEELWNLEKISAPDAWASTTGEDIIVGVIDTGVDFGHPDLIDRMWTDPNCKDYQGNVVPGGCMHGGWDFSSSTVTTDDDPSPEGSGSNLYHGTHVAGIIAATYENHEGIIGVAPRVKIMALRFGLNTGSEARAIDFAIANGAKIINASFSGWNDSTPEREAIERFAASGGIFIAAAGNGADDDVGDDLDHLPDPPFTATSTARAAYPAQYSIPNIVSVTATDRDDALASFANYGASSVDLGAPGIDILSTAPGTTYRELDGTSMATPHVTGTAALLAGLSFAHHAPLTALEIKDLILNEGDAVPLLQGTSVSGKRLNAHTAVRAALALDTAETVSEEPPQKEERPRRRGGGGGGGGGNDDEVRLPQVLGATTLTPEVQARIAYLTALVQKLLAIIAAMKAAGME